MEANELLIKLRNIYLFNVDEDGEPKTNISEIMHTWENVNKLLDER